MGKLINVETASKEELLKEYDKCQENWSKWSCDCFGYYMIAIHKRIIELGGFPVKKEINSSETK